MGHLRADIDQEMAARLLSGYVWTATNRIEEDLEAHFDLLAESGEIPPGTSSRDLVDRIYRSGEQ